MGLLPPLLLEAPLKVWDNSVGSVVGCISEWTAMLEPCAGVGWIPVRLTRAGLVYWRELGMAVEEPEPSKTERQRDRESKKQERSGSRLP